MKLTYRQRIFFYFFVVFAFFAVSIIIIEQKDEKKYRTEALEDKLDGYVEVIHRYMEQYQLTDSSVNELHKLSNVFPNDIRITIINKDGNVLFDKDVPDVKTLDNHLNRPEIRNASFQSYGSNIRMSASTQHEYIYYAKKYQNYFVRVALPYNIETKGLMKADNMFIYIVVGLFVVVLILLNFVAGRFGKSISHLKNLTTSIKDNKALPTDLEFPEDELGEIGKQLVDILKQKEKNKRDIEVEREKLLQHFQFSEKGICIYTSDLQKIYANTHFYQFTNLIVDTPTFDPGCIFKEPIFSPIFDFINSHDRKDNNYAFRIEKSGKIFYVHTIIFEDNSFEITIQDITKTEKTRLMKQEMTNNIAHELRTPVTSLRGYLETLSEQTLPADKQAQFIDRAHKQVLRLSTLIEDISIISKIEEAGSQFELEKINLHQLIDEVRIDMTNRLTANNITLNISVDDHLIINGNYTLLYSIFSNLIDNSINHCEPSISIYINNYMEDTNYLYFSYYDTGKGVEEQYLGRLFERFYRIDEGRTRNAGGSGLGLSIVKNAVLFHKGEIQAKNRVGGGLEFLFTLRK